MDAAGGWINKMKGMIYHVLHGGELVGFDGMLPTHQNGWLYIMVQCGLAYDGQESGSIMSGYDLHVP